MLTRKNASLLLIATLAEITANLQRQEPELPLTRSMGAACYLPPVETVLSVQMSFDH